MADEIITKVSSCFTKAVDTGDVFFYPSTLHPYQDGPAEFEIRSCPALLHKPTLPTPHFDKASLTQDHRKDPFEEPYNPNLFVGEVNSEDGDYAVLLNKFAVVRDHFILVTKKYASQNAPLTPPDLVQAYLLLVAAKKAGKHFMAFYNCGDRSGASQPHKHIQFIPIEDDGPPIEKLARVQNPEEQFKPFTISSLPYAHFINRFPSATPAIGTDILEDLLGTSFMGLLDRVISTIRQDPDHPSGSPSYNVLLTLEHLYLIPRRREKYTFKDSKQEEMSVNALGFAGMLLVKSDDDFEGVKREGPLNILKGVAIPPYEIIESTPHD